MQSADAGFFQGTAQETAGSQAPGGGNGILTKNGLLGILRTPCSREISGLLYLQSAIAGVMAC